MSTFRRFLFKIKMQNWKIRSKKESKLMYFLLYDYNNIVNKVNEEK